METAVIARSGDPLDGSAFDSPCYRIPALTVTATGRVLLAWDVRAGWRDLPGDFDVVYRTSDDHGRTWGPVRVLRRHGDGHGFGDASLIADPATGNVLCWYVGSTGRSYFTAEPCAGQGLELWLAISTDDGETWEHRDLSALRPDWVGGMFAASGNGIALGRPRSPVRCCSRSSCVIPAAAPTSPRWRRPSTAGSPGNWASRSGRAATRASSSSRTTAR